jgi:hypothetical protein
VGVALVELPFWVSISILGLVQAALVALPRGPLPELPRPLRLSSRWWALVPAGSIVAVIAVIELDSGSATALAYLALVAVPPLAALALGLLVRAARAAWALAAIPLFALAWADPGSLAGEVAATALSGLACVSLGWLLVSVVPAFWLRLGIYAMAALDTYVVATDILQGPNSVLTVAHPAAGLPRLQAVHFGSAAMGFGDLFVAALVGCLLAPSRPRFSADGPKTEKSLRFLAHRQLVAAGLVAALALAFDLLFFAVDELPATVPVAVALALAQRYPWSDGARSAQL